MHTRNLRKSLGLIVILYLLIYINALAQGTADSRKHCIWKVSSKTNTVYIVGSVHLMKEDNKLDEIFEQVYKDSRRLFFEVDLDHMGQQKTQEITAGSGLYPEGVTLKDRLSKQAYESASKGLSSLGLNIEQVENLKPWLISVTIATARLQMLGYDPNRGVDRYFFNKAGKDGKKVEGLETMDYQLNLFASMSDKMQEEMLLQTLKDLDEIESNVDSIMAAWKTGDTKTLEDTLLKSFEEYPEMYKLLITDRNRNWLPKIESLLRQNEKSMVVVGAAHLIGKNGIISALRQKGYMIEQQ